MSPLDGLPHASLGPEDCRQGKVNRRLRLSYLGAAEADARLRLGRGLTAVELEQVVQRYTGDVGETRER